MTLRGFERGFPGSSASHVSNGADSIVTLVPSRPWRRVDEECAHANITVG